LTAQKQTEQDRLEFIDAATHDLKTPLTGLKAQTQLMLRRLRRGAEVDRAALENGLTMTEAAATRMARLIDDLVDAARLRAGQALTLTLDATDLVETAQRCVESAQQTTERHRLLLNAEESSLVGTWDGARLERVLSNLISNAVKYSPDGGPIELTIRREEQGSQPWAVLSVRDRGLGIPAVDLPHIFDRFRRGSNVGDLPGAGIGLAGVRQIVVQHGGAITATSADGEGSTFTLELPLTPPAIDSGN
jgi:signal transduction histidine kinase